MKGIVVEVKNNKTVVLADNGEFIKLNHVYNVGETFDIPSRIGISHVRRNLLAACAALMIFLGAGGIYAATTPYSYVTVDVNPSIEYSVNYFDNVISTKALNKDGKAVVKSLSDVKGSKVTAAVDDAIGVMEDKGYIDKSEISYAIVSVVSKDNDRTKSISKDLATSIKKSDNDKLTVDVVIGTMSDRETAQKINTSTGRLQVAKQLTDSTNSEILKDSSKAREIKKTGDKPVKKLVESAKDKQTQDEKASKDNGNSGNSGGSDKSSSTTDKNKPDNATNGNNSGGGSEQSNTDKNSNTNSAGDKANNGGDETKNDNDRVAPPGNIVEPQGGNENGNRGQTQPDGESKDQ